MSYKTFLRVPSTPPTPKDIFAAACHAYAESLGYKPFEDLEKWDRHWPEEHAINAWLREYEGVLIDSGHLY